MKIEGYLFALLAVFLGICAAVYWWLSEDWTGTTCITLSCGLAFMIGYYLLFTSRRMEPRPEDRSDAEIEEGAGEVGFFSPYSYWPIIVAAAFSMSAVGLVFEYWWLVLGSGVAILVSSAGMLFEYYVDKPFSN